MLHRNTRRQVLQGRLLDGPAGAVALARLLRGHLLKGDQRSPANSAHVTSNKASSRDSTGYVHVWCVRTTARAGYSSRRKGKSPPHLGAPSFLQRPSHPHHHRECFPSPAPPNSPTLSVSLYLRWLPPHVPPAALCAADIVFAAAPPATLDVAPVTARPSGMHPPAPPHAAPVRMVEGPVILEAVEVAPEVVEDV